MLSPQQSQNADRALLSIQHMKSLTNLPNNPLRCKIAAPVMLFQLSCFQADFSRSPQGVRPRKQPFRTKNSQKLQTLTYLSPKFMIPFFKGYSCTFPELMFNSFLLWNNNYFHTVLRSMCFLKAYKSLDQLSFDKDSNTQESSFQENQKQHQPRSFLNQLLQATGPVFLGKQDGMLRNLMLMVAANNLALEGIEQKLQQNQQSLKSSHESLASVMTALSYSAHTRKTPENESEQESSDQLSTPSSTLLTQLFGPKKYAYKLQLQESLPSTIYKERNINISVNLLDQNSEKIMNSNIIHLCLGVCDANGNWISQNKVGENFMKGKTEVEMYHGDGSFLKVYPRDVSRHYAEGKVHFVVYSKPSMIKFSSNSTSMERVVNSSEIEPLIISDLTIRAKKN